MKAHIWEHSNPTTRTNESAGPDRYFGTLIMLLSLAASFPGCKLLNWDLTPSVRLKLELDVKEPQASIYHATVGLVNIRLLGEFTHWAFATVATVWS